MSVDATKATWLLNKKQVTPTQKLILLSYADRAGENHECWPSNKRLEIDTGFDRHTICQNKQELIKKGLMSYTGQKKGKTKSVDVVRLNYVKGREVEESSVDFPIAQKQSSGEMPIPSSGEMPIPKQWGNAHTEPKRKNLKEEPNTYVDFQSTGESESDQITENPPSSYQDDLLFMQFYSIYPNKQKPELARKAFYRHKPDKEFVSMLCADVQARIANNWKNRHKSKIPHPTTYLNAKEWEGEIYASESDSSTKTKRFDMDELTAGIL